MTQLELNEIVEHALNDARISGCIASNFREDLAAAERHRDGEKLSIRWHDRGDGRRCTIFAGEVQPYPLAQVDLGENASLRIETFAPCRVTVSQEEGFLCLSRCVHG